MRVLLAGFGTRGDVQPMVALARGLIHRGHSATVAGPPDFESFAAEFSVPYVSVGESIVRFLSRVSDPKGNLVPRLALKAMPGWIRSHYEPLNELVPESDVVVAASMTVAPLDLAEKHQKRAHYVAYCPQAIPSRDHPMAFVSNHGLPGWVNKLSFSLGALGHNTAIRSHIDDERKKLGLPRSRETWDHILYQNLIVASDPAIAPLPSDVRKERWVLQTGALFLERDTPLSDELEAFLSAGAPPVYVGFGSMPDVDREATWKWVTEGAQQASARVVLLDSTARRTESVMTVVDTHHQRLFPRCAGVIHHGGAGTTVVAAKCGAPQVISPHVTDQFFWRHRLKRLGLHGPDVEPRARDVKQLAAALKELTSNQSLSSRAREFGGQVRGDGVERAVAALEKPLG